MTFSLTLTQAWLLLGATCLTILVHVTSTAWIALQARHAWRDNRERLDLERRALDLVAYARKHRLPTTAQNEKGQTFRVDIKQRTFVLGDDRLRDRAAVLAQEWGAVSLTWHGGSYEVRLRDGEEAR